MSVLALTSSEKLGILAVAVVFIGFALVSSFVIPRRYPNYPGRRVGLFAVVSVALFVAMLTAMFTLAAESENEGQGTVAEETTGGTTGGETTGGQTGTGETQPAAAAGDPAAGKQVFTAAGCVGCHTLADAGAKGTIGPNLDQAKPDHALVVERVTNGKGPMPSFKDNLSEEDIQNVAAYVVQATSGS